MNTPQDSSLGREVAYPTHYDPGLLFPIPRAQGRSTLGLDAGPLPFTGHDRWHAYELSWLDARGMPQVGTATLHVPADSPRLVESKSLKLYLNSLNATRFDSAGQVHARIAADVGQAAGAPVRVEPGLPPLAEGNGEGSVDLDRLALEIDDYGPPNPAHLRCDPGDIASQALHSALLKSNCPVTGQPDWASVHIACHGPRIDPAGLLRYLVSFRDHSGFHEQCVEQIFMDLMTHCSLHQLSVEARYTRRGGLDINPWRATPGTPPPPALRDVRQ